MKPLYILLVFLFVFTYSNAQIVDIPDASFKYALVNSNCVDTNGNGQPDSDADVNNDGEIQVAEAEAVLGLYVFMKNISSLEGIQSFVNIEFLECSSNQIENLNITQNLNLEILRCKSNLLNSLDLTQNQNLVELYCSSNNLSTIDISYNINLEEIWCNNNGLTFIDISNNQNLIRLYCYNNDLTSIDTSQNIELQGLSAGSNQITTFDLSQNLNLISLGCGFNQLTILDLSLNSNLATLGCWGNDLVKLNIANGNNSNMLHMDSRENLNLVCIQVDDVNATYPICDTVNYTGWCIDDWTSYSEECILGIEENTALGFSIYPNPAQDFLFIETQQPIETVKIYNLQGQLIKEISESTIDVSQLNSGMYFVQVIVEGKTQALKFIKE